MIKRFKIKEFKRQYMQHMQRQNDDQNDRLFTYQYYVNCGHANEVKL